MSAEIEQTESIAEFVTLKNHDDYEILTVYPHTIRRKSNHHVVSENKSVTGYIRVYVDGKLRQKHRLIAEHFIPNPDNLEQIDHINHQRDDNHIRNLRWISISGNKRNQASYRGVQVRYVDSIPDEAILVDFYETKTERHEFEGYYYHDGRFYYDNDMNYRVLNVIINNRKCKYVSMRDKDNKAVCVVIQRFLEQHDLVD